METLRRLLRSGAVLSQPNSAGHTVLRLALSAGQHRIVRMLLDYCYRVFRLRQRMAWAISALDLREGSLVRLPAAVACSVGVHLAIARSSRTAGT